MSTYYTYFFRAPLKAGSLDSPEVIRSAAQSIGIRIDVESEPLSTVSTKPHFGRSTVYDGPDFDVLGMDITDGYLQIGVFAENLERAEFEGDDSVKSLDRLLGFLSDITEGAVGEVQGSFGTEYDDADLHGHPIIRCADGRLRILRTEALDEYDWYHGEPDPRERYEGPLVSIGRKIPIEFTDRYASSTHLTDIHDDLVEHVRRAAASSTLPHTGRSQ